MLLLSLCALQASGLTLHATQKVSPIEKVLQLLGDLQAKIIKEGESVEKLFEEFTDYCKGGSKDTQFAIKTAKGDAERFTATKEETAAEITASPRRRRRPRR